MMRTSLLCLLCALLLVKSSGLMAQDLGHTQYYMNLPSINPGFTGVEDFWDTKLAFRQGWNNLESNNNSFFASSYGTIHSAFRSRLVNNSLRISDPDAYNQIERNESTRKTLFRRHGLGGMVSNRQLGSYRSTSFSLNYAYHIPVSEKFRWSFGVNVGYNSQQIGFGDFTVRDAPNDIFYQQLILSNTGRLDLMTIDFGSVFYSQSFYLGISSTALARHELLQRNFNSFLPQRYDLQTGTFLNLGAKMELNPVVRLSYSQISNLGWGVMTRMRYNRLVYMGVGYQSTQKLSAVFGFTIDGKYSLNYSYDHYLSTLSGFSVNAHEVVLGISLFNKYGAGSKNW